MLFFHKKNPPARPAGLNWYWTLTVDGMPADRDSYVALERMDPNDPREAGFLQCTATPEGRYLLECGYLGPEGPVLRQREVNSSEAVRAAFETVYRQKGTDFPGFSDLSDALGQD